MRGKSFGEKPEMSLLPNWLGGAFCRLCLTDSCWQAEPWDWCAAAENKTLSINRWHIYVWRKSYFFNKQREVVLIAIKYAALLLYKVDPVETDGALVVTKQIMSLHLFCPSLILFPPFSPFLLLLRDSLLKSTYTRTLQGQTSFLSDIIELRCPQRQLAWE